MALPPEQINIKRRREEEPVETLCTFPERPLFTCLGSRTKTTKHPKPMHV